MFARFKKWLKRQRANTAAWEHVWSDADARRSNGRKNFQHIPHLLAEHYENFARVDAYHRRICAIHRDGSRVDDSHKSASLGVGVTPRRSTSSLKDSIYVAT
jgi:hypothetical protein